MKHLKNIVILYALIFITSVYSASLNLVVFSRNRPAELCNFLESFIYNSKGCQRISIIYRADSDDFEAGYSIVKQAFPQVEFLQQSQNPNTDFKRLTLKAIGFGKEEYIVFAVDDITVTRPIDFDEITEVLGQTDFNGFYLRLGRHITECYSENRVVGTPPFKEVLPGVLSWSFKKGQGDWGYPNTVDMTVYRKQELQDLFMKLPFTNPNLLEGNWAGQPPVHPKGLCYEYAAMVNCPLNRVQTTYNNRHSNAYTPQELLDIFLSGYKLDFLALQNVVNKAPHMDYKPAFIAR